MKRKYLLMIAFVFVLMFIGVPNVFAVDLNQNIFDTIKASHSPVHSIWYAKHEYSEDYLFTLPSGEYTLVEDIQLDAGDAIAIDGTNVTINMGGHSISGDLEYSGIIRLISGNLIIDGSGTIENNHGDSKSVDVENGEATFNGTVEYSDNVAIDLDTTVTINGGTFNGVDINGATSVVINGGVFKKNNRFYPQPIRSFYTPLTINGGTSNISERGVEVIFFMGGTVTINDGTFVNSEERGIGLLSEAGTLYIKGGTFSGGEFGYKITGGTVVELSGGTFIASDENATEGAISSGDSFSSLLATGYKYSVESSNESGKFGAKEVSVIPKTYTITFKNGDVTLDSRVYNYGSTITYIPLSPTKDGHIFKEWGTIAGGYIDQPVTMNIIFIPTWADILDLETDDSQSFYSESDEDITIVSDVPYTEFQYFVLKNGDTSIEMSNLTEGVDYVVEEGSTKLTLKNSFLKTLSSGDYSVQMHFTNYGTYHFGATETTLSVRNGSIPTSNPQTGDDILLYYISLLFGVICLVGFGITSKKRFN